jgi:hypothetical protein
MTQTQRLSGVFISTLMHCHRVKRDLMLVPPHGGGALWFLILLLLLDRCVALQLPHLHLLLRRYNVLAFRMKGGRNLRRCHLALHQRKKFAKGLSDMSCCALCA